MSTRVTPEPYKALGGRAPAKANIGNTAVHGSPAGVPIAYMTGAISSLQFYSRDGRFQDEASIWCPLVFKGYSAAL